MIYTLDHIEKEALLISGYWNGSDEKYVDGNGEARTDDDAQEAAALLEAITEVRAMVAALGI